MIHLKPSKPAKKTDRYVLFEKQMLLTGNGKRKKELDVGQYQYSFSLYLPSSLPCSLETKYCHVRYLVKAEILRAWKFNHQTKAAFSVNSTLDLNQLNDIGVCNVPVPESSCIPIFQESQVGNTVKEIGWIWFKLRTVELSLEVNKSGAVPGEIVIISAVCQNHSKQKHLTSTLSLIQVTSFVRITKSAKVKKIIWNLKLNYILTKGIDPNRRKEANHSLSAN